MRAPIAEGSLGRLAGCRFPQILLLVVVVVEARHYRRSRGHCGKGLSYQTVHNPRLEHSARLVQFLSPVVDRILAVQHSGCRLSLLPKTIDSTNGLALLIHGPKPLQNEDMVRRIKIQPSRSKSWGEDENGGGLYA